MSKFRRNIIRVVIVIKSLLMIGILIGLIARVSDQYIYCTSGSPEHEAFAKLNGKIMLRGLLILILFFFSVIVDFKEQKNAVLKGKWYLLTLAVIACCILINQLKESYADLIGAIGMIIGFTMIIRKQNQLITNY